MEEFAVFRDLTEESREKLWTRKLVNFQGEKVSLRELFTQDEDRKRILNTDVLETLAGIKEIKIELEVQQLKEPKQSCYFSRIFKRGEEEIRETDILKSQEKVMLIAGDAGSGKTTSITKLATTIKSENPHFWVSVIKLQDFIEIFTKCQKKDENTITIPELLSFKDAATTLTTSFKDSVFRRSKSVVLLLDDIDQAFPHYTQFILELLAECQEAHNVSKVILTSRLYVARQLEKEIGIEAFVLQPFTHQKLVEYLVDYWMYHLRLQEASKERCGQCAEELIKKVSSSCHDIDVYFVRTPIGTQLLAELFIQCAPAEESAVLEECRKFLIADSPSTKFSLKSIDTISRLIECFVKKMRDVFIDKANDSTTEGQALYEECLACHRTLAVDAILGENRRGLFSGSRQVDKKMGASILQIGIVKKWENELCFAYDRITQYFAAKSLLIELQSLNENVEFQKYFLEELLFNPKQVVVRAFLDNFLRKVVDYLPSTTFHKYQLLCREVDEVSNLNLIHQLAQEGCTALLRLVLKCIDYQIVRDEEIDIDCTKIIPKHSNVLKNLHYFTQRAGVNIKNESGKTPLHLAATGGYLDTVRYLTEQGANVNIKDNFGWTPLHFSAAEGHLDTVKFLVDQEADVNIKNHYGWSPLHFGAEKGDLDIVKFLIERKADVNTEDCECITPLYSAAMEGHLDTVKFLITNGAGMNIKDRWGQTLFHYTAGRGHLDTVKFLVGNGADVNILNSYGHTPLHSAAEVGHLDVAKFLVEQGAYINIKANGDWAPLHFAAYKGHLDIVEFLVEQGADISMKDKVCETALHAAASEGYLDVIEFLVEQGADVNVKNNCGQTPLHFAAKEGQLDVVKFLVEQGAVADIKDDLTG